MPPLTHPEVRAQRDLVVRSEDGTALLTDHWWAEGAGGTTVLIRTPYGRAAKAGLARFLAERGHHVVIQSCRGTFGSGGGPFEAETWERADGSAALAWVRAQPWATGPVHTHGVSYEGLTQWALCTDEDRPEAMVIAMSSRGVRRAVVPPDGGIGMDTLLTWCTALALQERGILARLVGLLRARGRVRRSALVRPPAGAPRAATGTDQPFARRWLLEPTPDPLPGSTAPGAGNLPPITLIGGWQDVFCTRTLADHAELRAAGVDVRLLMGDWTHSTPGSGTLAVRETLRMLAGREAPPVRVEVTGGGGLRTLPQWPPQHRELVLRPSAAHALTWDYDPADPTPAVGGRSLNPFTSGHREQSPREARADVVLLTSAPLRAPLEVMGTPRARLRLTSTAPRPDLFVRLCEVDARGRSTDVTDGYLRAAEPWPPGRPTLVEVAFAPLAHRFAADSRIRLQVSSGAHPLHLRNPGTADPRTDHSRLVPSHQELHPEGSSVHLPIPLPDEGTVEAVPPPGASPPGAPPLTPVTLVPDAPAHPTEGTP